MHNPSIILINTQLPENIGAAARAMMNFGLEDLRLVAPREEWPNKRAYDLAGHAAPVLDSAKLFATTREAVADFERVYATTARSREMVKPVFTPAEGMARITKELSRTAILFGPERTGLTNDDVTIADAVITIPTASDLTSLNIAQSVVVIAYEWFTSSCGLPEAGAQDLMRSRALPFGQPRDDKLVHKSAFATKEELQSFFDHLERELDHVDFWKTADKKTKMWLNLRNIFTRADLTEQEVRTLHGVIAEIKKGG